MQCNIVLLGCERMKGGEAMARPLRIEYPGAVYHVTSRGNARNMIFNDDHDRSKFLKVFGTVLQNLRWLCHARGGGLLRPLSAAVVAEKRSRGGSQVATTRSSAAAGGSFSRFGGTTFRRQGSPHRLGLYPEGDRPTLGDTLFDGQQDAQMRGHVAWKDLAPSFRWRSASATGPHHLHSQ